MDTDSEVYGELGLDPTTPEDVRERYREFYDVVIGNVAVVDEVVPEVIFGTCVTLRRGGSKDSEGMAITCPERDPEFPYRTAFFYQSHRLSDFGVEFDLREINTVISALEERWSGVLSKHMGVDFVGGFAYFYSPKCAIFGRECCCPVTFDAVDALVARLHVMASEDLAAPSFTGV